MNRSGTTGRDAPSVEPLPTRSRDETSAADTDQTAADADQTAADLDQTAADVDQASSETDQRASQADQRSSDADQTTADRDDTSSAGPTHDAYRRSRNERARTTRERKASDDDRTDASHDRSAAARLRDVSAAQRDQVALGRDEHAAARDASVDPVHTTAGRAMERMRRRAAADRAAAARDRARAAADRETAAQARAMAARDRERAVRDLASMEAVRAEVEAQLKRAHLDDLTGAYRRDMGQTAISHEIDRARRGDGRFVLCFIDLDQLKVINDRDGHAAGDRALIAVIAAVRANLRSFDPILRYGGDEFIAGLGGTDLDGAERRFRTVQGTLGRRSDLRISVGFAQLEQGDGVEDLIDRADRDMYRRRAEAQHEARSDQGRAGRGPALGSG